LQIRVFVLALLAALAFAASAAAAPPAVHARAYFIQDASTGETIAAYHAQERLPMASITKLMTVLLTLEHAKLSSVVTVGSGIEPGGSSIYLHRGDRLTVRDLLEGALIQSANDAADALAQYVGHGDTARFVAMMNQRARQLGLTHTHFVRPDGLDAPGHYSSAHDLTTLARVLMTKPFVRRTVRMRSATIAGGRHLSTWNDLLSTFPGVIGVKTGHTSNAGWCQVAAVRGPGLTVYATILGEPTRAQRNADLAALLRWGLSRYRLATVISPRRAYTSVQAPFGRGPIKLVAAHAVHASVRIGRSLKAVIVAPTMVALPVERGQAFGEVRVYDGARLVARAPLVAAKSVGYPSLPARAGWYAKQVGKKLTGWIP
jgi:D-alanyl-D-alanine carboxypeptidase (penicillin-binding protein 5/6)